MTNRNITLKRVWYTGQGFESDQQFWLIHSEVDENIWKGKNYFANKIIENLVQ